MYIFDFLHAVLTSYLSKLLTKKILSTTFVHHCHHSIPQKHKRRSILKTPNSLRRKLRMYFLIISISAFH